MKAILVDDETPVYGSMEDQTISITTIHKGEEMDLGKVSQKKGKSWVEINLPGGQKGYITGDTKIFAIRKASVFSGSIDMKEAPSKESNTLKTLVKGTVVTVTRVEKEGEDSWYCVRDETGAEGFIPASSKLRVVPELSRSGATRNMITGFIFTVIGIFLTLSNYKTSSSNAMVLISYAVIFFGLLQLGQGVMEYIKVVRAANNGEKK